MTLSSLPKLLQKAESFIAAALLSAMILMSCLQIFLRLFFDSGLSWIDQLLRYLVVWGGLFGAMLAVSRNKHISLDISKYLLPEKMLVMTRIIAQFFGCLICGVLTYASFLFIQSEIEFGNTSFLMIPSWGWNLIFPLAFAVMSLRFLLATIIQIRTPHAPISIDGNQKI